MILSRSNSYNFYKNQYEKYIAGDIEDVAKIEKEFKQLKKEFEEFKNQTNDHMDSTTYLLKNVYVDHELNEPRNVLGYVQTLSKELLILISKICKENDLEFWLDYGNLLGAVRHGNFVPWDDDVDISMLREDYLKLDRIISREVKKHGLSEIVEVGYRPHVRVKGVGRFIQVYVRHKVDKSGKNKPVLGNVDVFPYDYIKEFDLDTLDDVFLESKTKYYNYQKRFFNRQFYLDTYYEDLNLTYEPTEYLLPGCEGPCGPDEIYDLDVYEADKMFPLGEIEFAGKMYPCPNDVHHHLKKIYKDYLSVPKSLYRHDRIGYYRYNTNNEEVFEKCIRMLREVNAEFRK